MATGSFQLDSSSGDERLVVTVGGINISGYESDKVDTPRQHLSYNKLGFKVETFTLSDMAWTVRDDLVSASVAGKLTGAAFGSRLLVLSPGGDLRALDLASESWEDLVTGVDYDPRSVALVPYNF